MRKLILIITAILAASSISAKDSSLFITKNSWNTPLFVAHRGLQPFGPENSIVAFQAAADHKVWAIETDFRITKDNQVVCIHDAKLDRTTTGSGLVADYTLEELKSFSVKEINTKGARKLYYYPYLTKDELRIPTMDEYLEICSKAGCVAFIELKEDNGIIAMMNKAIKKHKMTGRCVISSSKIELLKAYRKTGKEYIHLIFAKGENIDDMIALGNAGVAFNVPKLSGDVKVTYKGKLYSTAYDLVKLCHSKGLIICFRAVDTLAKAKKSLELGIDYLPTNNLWELESFTRKAENTYGCHKFMTKTGNNTSIQGMDIYNDRMFILENKGECHVYDFTTKSPNPVGSFFLESAQKDNHSNCVNFGIEKTPGSEFPLLYVSVGKMNVPIEWTCFVEGIHFDGHNYSSKLYQTITLDTSGFKEAGYTPLWGCPCWLVDKVTGELWVFSAIRRTLVGTTQDPKLNKYIATKFRLPKLSDGEKIILTVKDVEKQVLFDFDAYITQGGCIYDGKIYYSFGFKIDKHPETPAQIRVYDTRTGKICDSLDLTGIIPEEPEDICIYNNTVYVNTNSDYIYTVDKLNVK